MASGNDDVRTEIRVPGVVRSASLPTKEVPEYLHKVFNDPAHGHIKLHTQLLDFIDTPIFQRLRSIRHMAGTYYVFPGATHNRFEHAIGMCYLAGELLKTIGSQQSDNEEIGVITDIHNILSVQIAALCRNIGYGPFSKVYHEIFLPLVKGDDAPKLEDTSRMMFDHLVKYLKDNKDLRDESIDQKFIKDLMCGVENSGSTPSMKSFLYQIVHNRDTSIDVDLWDSLARDCQHVHINTPFDHTRLIKFTRVLDVSGKGQMCYRDKEIGNLYDMYHAHEIIKRRALQHKTVVSVERMIAEALAAADGAPEIRIKGTNGKLLKLSDCVTDPVAFEKLDDSILNTILHTECEATSSDGLKKAQEILQRIQRRKLYKFVGSVKPVKGKDYSKSAVDIGNDICVAPGIILEPKDIYVKVIKFDYTEEGMDPVERVQFYTKKKPNTPRQITKEQVSHILPEVFRDTTIMVFVRDLNKTDYARDALRKWCKKNKDVIVPHDMEDEAQQPDDATK